MAIQALYFCSESNRSTGRAQAGTTNSFPTAVVRQLPLTHSVDAVRQAATAAAAVAEERLRAAGGALATSNRHAAEAAAAHRDESEGYLSEIDAISGVCEVRQRSKYCPAHVYPRATHGGVVDRETASVKTEESKC
jgi:hypothetical protein